MDILLLAEAIGLALVEKKYKLVTAESCTGGGLAYALTAVPGSSQWFERGFVTYSNEAKISLIKVNPLTLKHYGAVSEQIVHEMAEGALKNSQAQISMAITGFAGPRTAKEPVGLIWIAISTAITTMTYSFIQSGNRQEIREQTIEKALAYLLSLIK